MSLAEIKDSIDTLEEKDKETLTQYIHELLIYIKRQDSKTISLKTEIKYLTRHLKKVRDMIDKTLVPRTKETETWKE